MWPLGPFQKKACAPLGLGAPEPPGAWWPAGRAATSSLLPTISFGLRAFLPDSLFWAPDGLCQFCIRYIMSWSSKSATILRVFLWALVLGHVDSGGVCSMGPVFGNASHSLLQVSGPVYSALGLFFGRFERYGRDPRISPHELYMSAVHATREPPDEFPGLPDMSHEFAQVGAPKT